MNSGFSGCSGCGYYFSAFRAVAVYEFMASSLVISVRWVLGLRDSFSTCYGFVLPETLNPKPSDVVISEFHTRAVSDLLGGSLASKVPRAPGAS